MKKNLLLLLITLTALTFGGCEKEESSPVKNIKGLWKNTAYYTKYYNEKGEKIFTQQDTSGYLDFEIHDKYITMTGGDEEMDVEITAQYNLTTTGSIDYLNLTSAFGAENFRIETLSDTKLILEIDSDDKEYTKDDETLTAAKAVEVMEFIKK